MPGACDDVNVAASLHHFLLFKVFALVSILFCDMHIVQAQLHWQSTAPATGNVKMKRVCFCCKHVCFSSANVGVVFSLPRLDLETRRKSQLVPYSGFPFVIFRILRLRRKRYLSVRRPGTAY